MVNDVNGESAIAYLNEGNQLRDAGFYDQALECYGKALAINPENADIHNQQAEVYCLQGKAEEAIACCQKALTIQPNYAVAYKTLGNAFIAVGKLEEARESYGKAVEIQSDYAAPLANLGSIYAQEQNWQQAIFYYQKAIAIQPNFAGFYRNLARVFSQIGKPDEATECGYLGLILEPDKAKAEEFINLGNTLLEQGKQERAVICYRRAIVANPILYEAHYKLGKNLAAHQQWDEAELCYRKTIELNPNWADAYLSLGQTLEALGKCEDAIACYSKAVNLEPESVLFHYSLGEALAKKWQWDRAISAYQKTIQLEPNYFEAHQRLGEAFHAVGKLEDAIICYSQALAISSNIGVLSKELDSLQFNLGLALQTQGKFEEAIACYLKSLEFSPESGKVYHHLGTALSDVQRWDDAAVAFRHAIELSTDSFWSHHQLGFVLTVLQRWDEALVSFCHALALNPEAESVHSHLGVILGSLPKWDEALASFRLAVDMNPNSAEVHYYLGTVLALVQQHDEAVACYQQAIQLKPGLFWLHKLLGETLFKIGVLDEALLFYQRAVHLQQKNGEAYFYLGMLLNLQGKVDEAITAYEKAVQIQPDSVEYYWNLAWLLSQRNQWDEAISYYQKVKEIKPEVLTTDLSKTSKYTFIKLHSLNQADLKVIERSRLSIDNLKLTEQDNTAWKEVYPKIFTYSPDMPCEEFEMPQFQKGIIETGYLEVVCPFSGEKLKSNQSFYIYPYYEIIYRFVGVEVFYLIVGCWHSFKVGIYIPNQELIISFSDDTNSTMIAWQEQQLKSFVDTFKFYNYRHGIDVKEYIDNKTQKKLAAHVGGIANIGHFFWNQVSALQALQENKKLNKIDAFVIGQYHYFNITDIFPEIETESAKPPAFFNINAEHLPDQVFSMCLKNNLFLFNISSLLITERTANRLYHRSFVKCAPSFLQQVRESKKHFPLLWITIRSHTRAWLGQVEGIANLVKELYIEYPDLGVIFDGVPAEKANLDQILALIPSEVKTYNALNCAIYETIVWSHAIDLFVAPYGAGLIFPCQIANKIGVMHTHKYGCRLEPFCLNPREKAVSIIPVSREAIVDIVDSEYDNPNTRNYECDWKAIYSEVVKLVRVIPK
ncbi:MAG: tetratricopeptide repeat protein [Microcoleus sp.]